MAYTDNARQVGCALSMIYRRTVYLWRVAHSKGGRSGGTLREICVLSLARRSKGVARSQTYRASERVDKNRRVAEAEQLVADEGGGGRTRMERGLVHAGSFYRPGGWTLGA